MAPSKRFIAGTANITTTIDMTNAKKDKLLLALYMYNIISISHRHFPAEIRPRTSEMAASGGDHGRKGKPESFLFQMMKPFVYLEFASMNRSRVR